MHVYGSNCLPSLHFDTLKKMKEKLGFNDSSLHWDLINTENKRVTAKLKNGTTVTVYEKGEFSY